MTPTQVLITSMLGGFFTVVFTALSAVIALGFHRLFSHAAAVLEERRTRREHLKTCRAIDALGTTNEPKE